MIFTFNRKFRCSSVACEGKVHRFTFPTHADRLLFTTFNANRFPTFGIRMLKADEPATVGTNFYTTPEGQPALAIIET